MRESRLTSWSYAAPLCGGSPFHLVGRVKEEELIWKCCIQSIQAGEEGTQPKKEVKPDHGGFVLWADGFKSRCLVTQYAVESKDWIESETWETKNRSKWIDMLCQA